jgi:hypothetical protein
VDVAVPSCATGSPLSADAGASETGVKVASGSSNRPPTYVRALDRDAPSPFRDELSGLPGEKGVGARMHHKFIVLDFAKPSTRVYLGSYNMSTSADNFARPRRDGPHEGGRRRSGSLARGNAGRLGGR